MERAILEFLDAHDGDPKPFVWTKSAEEILASIARFGQRTADTQAAHLMSRTNVLGYSTGAIVWILGDPTKYWYTFPSLRAKALTVALAGFIRDRTACTFDHVRRAACAVQRWPRQPQPTRK